MPSKACVRTFAAISAAPYGIFFAEPLYSNHCLRVTGGSDDDSPKEGIKEEEGEMEETALSLSPAVGTWHDTTSSNGVPDHASFPKKAELHNGPQKI